MAFAWLSETAGILASASLLVTLAAVLGAYDDEAVFEWKGITLNAVVSTISTASKASLLYAISELISQWKWIIFTSTRRPLMDFERVDAASRGPMGSLGLFWRCKSIGCLRLGALIVLLSIAIDPLTQQLVQYKQRVVYSQSPETMVNRAGRYSKGNERFVRFGYTETSYLNTSEMVLADADFSMQSAILYGVGHPMQNIVQQGNFTCTTGNCTWPSFESLAVCNRCTNITLSLERKVTDSPQYLYLDYGDDSLHFEPCTDFQLSNGLYLGNADGWKFGDYGGVMMTTLGTPDPSKTMGAQGLDTLIWSVSMIRVDPDPANTTASWPNLPVSAMECALFYCVRSYENKVFNSILKENSKEVTDFIRAKDSWNPEGADFNRTNEWLINSIAYNSAFSTLTRTDLMLSSPTSGDRFNISKAAVDSISYFFQSTFTAGEFSSGKVNGYYMDKSQLTWSPSVMQVLFASKDFEETFAAMAASMSNEIRSGADDVFEGTPIGVVGMKGEISTFYRVVWPWISFHCFIVLCGIIFFGLTMWENQRHGQGVPLWRSSGLAIASRGEAVTDVLSGMQTLEEMWKKAKVSRVTFFDKNDVASSSLEHLDFDPLEESES